jgi:moderate conductance mechanosensitive channel
MLLATTARPLTLWVSRLTDSEFVLWTVGAVVEPLLVVAAVLVAASIVLRSVRRALRRMVARAKDPGPMLTGGRRGGETDDDDEQRFTRARRDQRADALGTLAESVVRVVVWGFAVLTALGTVGVDLGPLIAGAGVLGVAIGFGAQGIVRDFLSGVIMLVEDQYGVGDVIDTGMASGVVEEVSLRTTRLRDVNGVVWHIPNGAIARVGNMTQEWSRMLVDVDVAYETDLDRALELLADVVARFEVREDVRERLVGEPMEVVGVHALGESGITIRIICKTLPGQHWALGRLFRQVVKRELEAAGIEIPYPQRTVWHRGLPEGTTLPPLPGAATD